MFQTWTPRTTIARPPASGSRTAHFFAVLLVAVLLVPACGGHNKSENRIKPIQANLSITTFPGAPDPAVFLEKVSTTGDLVTVDVKLHNTTGSPIDFDAFTLEFTYDFNLVQVGSVFDVNPSLLGDCTTGTSCTVCLNNADRANQGLTVDANGKAHFIMGVSALPGCPTASVTSDTTLVTLGFIAASTIAAPVPANDPTNAPGRITLISGAGHGDCEILNATVDLGIQCVDGGAFLTASN
jgi:hypothetical protein